MEQDIRYVSKDDVIGVIKNNKFNFAVFNKTRDKFYILSENKVVYSNNKEYQKVKIERTLDKNQSGKYVENLYVKNQDKNVLLSQKNINKILDVKYYTTKELIKLEIFKSKNIAKLIEKSNKSMSEEIQVK